MKKILLPLLITALLTTGCTLIFGEPLDKALKNLAEANSYEIVLTTTTETNDTTIISNIYVDNSSKTNYINMKMESDEMEFQTNMYSKVDQDKLITYTNNSFSEEYIKQETSIDESDYILNNYSIDFKMLAEDFEFDKISTVDGLTTYKVKFNKGLITNEELDVEEPFIITVKDNQVTSMSTKFYDGEDTWYDVKFEISGINSTTVSIPQSVIDNAVLDETSSIDEEKEDARRFVKAMELYCARTMLNTGIAPTFATANANSSTVYEDDPVTLFAGDAKFTSGCIVTGQTATFNGYTLNELLY